MRQSEEIVVTVVVSGTSREPRPIAPFTLRSFTDHLIENAWALNQSREDRISMRIGPGGAMALGVARNAPPIFPDLSASSIT
jgi:hypothetical protein